MRKSPLAIARAFKKEIAKLEAQQVKLYFKAIRSLKIEDTGSSFDYFYNNSVGYIAFEERFKR